MSTLIAIGYPDETTAGSAAEEAHRMACDLILDAEAIAVISRNREGRLQVSTNHDPVAGGTSWGMSWGLLFGVLFFVPVFGMGRTGDGRPCYTMRFIEGETLQEAIARFHAAGGPGRGAA